MKLSERVEAQLAERAQQLAAIDAVAKLDLVNHPTHYKSHPSGVECIQITRHMSFDLGNALKYIWRAGLKDSDNEIQDIEKAIWYLTDHLNMLKGESGRG